MEKDVHKVILNNEDDSFLNYNNFENAVYSLYNTIIKKLVVKLNIYLENKDWKIHPVNLINKTTERGCIFISPKSIDCPHGFGIEELIP